MVGGMVHVGSGDVGSGDESSGGVGGWSEMSVAGLGSAVGSPDCSGAVVEWLVDAVCAVVGAVSDVDGVSVTGGFSGVGSCPVGVVSAVLGGGGGGGDDGGVGVGSAVIGVEVTGVDGVTGGVVCAGVGIGVVSWVGGGASAVTAGGSAAAGTGSGLVAGTSRVPTGGFGVSVLGVLRSRVRGGVGAKSVDDEPDQGEPDQGESRCPWMIAEKSAIPGVVTGVPVQYR